VLSLKEAFLHEVFNRPLFQHAWVITEKYPAIMVGMSGISQGLSCL